MSVMDFIGDVLSRLHRNGFPEAIVAGGALRDYDNGLADQVKDIDVFVMDRPTYLNDLNAAFRDWKHRLSVPEHVAVYMDFEGVRVVQEFTCPYFIDTGRGGIYSPPPVQVIVMSRPVEPQATIERHDFGICQIGYDGKTVYTTEAYETDKRNQTFTLVRCRDDRDFLRSLKRFARLSTKYPQWDMVSTWRG
jgi:hypothetical protein